MTSLPAPFARASPTAHDPPPVPEDPRPHPEQRFGAQRR